MKKFLKSISFVFLMLGVVTFATSFSDAMAVFKGESMDINTASLSDFTEGKLAKGEVYYIHDCIAVEEVTRTTYGIKTGKTETNFYMIESMDKDTFMNSDSEPLTTTYIYATANKKEIEKFDAIIEEWVDFYEKLNTWYEDENASEDDFPEYPVSTIEITGKICDYTDSKVIQYRDETIGEMVDDVEGYVKEYCPDKMIKYIDPASTKIMFIVSIVLTLAGIIGLIASFVAAKKKKEEELY